MKNRSVVYKREMAYQIKVAHEMKAAAQVNAHLTRISSGSVSCGSGSLQFSKKGSHQLMFVLMALGTMGIIVSGSRVTDHDDHKPSSSNPPNPRFDNQPNTVNVEVKTSFTGDNNGFGHTVNTSSNLCNTTKLVTNRHLFFNCSANAKQWYQENPGQYDKDVNHVHSHFKSLDQHQSVHCKLDNIMDDSRFQVQFVKNKLRSRHAAALYEQDKVRMLFSTQTRVTIDVADHEVHHAFIANENRRERRLYSPDIDVGAPLLYEDEVTFDKLTSSLKQGEMRIRSLLKGRSVTLMRKCQQAVKNYVPMTHETYLNIKHFDSWKTEGKLDTNYKIVGNGFDFSYDNSPILHAVGTVIEPGYSAVLAHVVHHGDMLKAALLDGLMQLIAIENLMKSKPDVVYEEADALIHQTYEFYPELFKLLYPELIEFHESRFSDKYRQCLR